MKCLRKYRDKMSDEKMAKYMIWTGLIKRGYKLSAAKKMLLDSGLLDYAINEPDLFFHCDGNYWADYIINGEFTEHAVG